MFTWIFKYEGLYRSAFRRRREIVEEILVGESNGVTNSVDIVVKLRNVRLVYFFDDRVLSPDHAISHVNIYEHSSVDYCQGSKGSVRHAFPSSGFWSCGMNMVENDLRLPVEKLSFSSTLRFPGLIFAVPKSEFNLPIIKVTKKITISFKLLLYIRSSKQAFQKNHESSKNESNIFIKSS